MRIRFISLFVLLLITVQFSANGANNSRTDTIDVTKYTIALTVTDYTNHTISGCTSIDFICKQNGINQLFLDLRSLTVDSVTSNGLSCIYNQVADLISINLPTMLNTGTVSQVSVYYHGTPYSDATWGGFTFNGVYAFNLGVGFSSNPHNLGSAWFPCIDNFADRSLFESYITTPLGYKAFCDGLLVDTVQNAGAVTWHWNMNKAVATYLMGVAVAPYATKSSTVTSISGATIPIELGCLASDTNAINTYFQKLIPAFTHFENCFGAYPFEKVGYVVVPFNGGAMEHASNIAIGRPFATGGLTYESIYPHELSHMWFGDLITCAKEEDMWLNEGWAAYCEKLFYEGVYNRQRYITETKANHLQVIEKCHLTDGGFYPMTPIPHSITYGSTVYDKGADMIHNLRTYMGDSVFFKSLHTYLLKHAWKTATSSQFRDSLIAYSGNANLNNFFNDWIFQAGYPDISLAQKNADQVNITVHKARHAAHGYTAIPVELSFFDTHFQTQKRSVLVNEGCNVFHFPEAVNAAYVALDFDELLSEAITADWKLITSNGTIGFTNAKMNLNVSSITDSVLVRVEHHWSRPEALKQPIPNFHLADRYWNVNGVHLERMQASATVTYNGTAGGSYIDKDFITNSEDSIVLLYRKDASEDWRILGATDATVNIQGSASNKTGAVLISHVVCGDYTMGIFDTHYSDTVAQAFPLNNCSTIAVPNVEKASGTCITISPSPSNNEIRLKLSNECPANIGYSIFDSIGKVVFSSAKAENSLLNLQLSNGTYYLKMNAPNCAVKTFIIQH